jgi:Tol biopolymer transport system component
MRLQKVELATSRVTDLVREKGISAGFGVWSNDGRQIAFQSQKGEDVQLDTIPADGGPITVWTEGHGKTWPGSWTADDQTIIAAAQRDGIWNLYAIGRDRSEKKLTDYSRLREFVRYPRISSSGDRIIYEYNETKGNIYIGELRP